jgi:serine/threonine-protein kinase
MSPEQVQGQAVDGRSDQFSLTVIAFEMLTGEKPYTGEHLTTVVYKIVAEEPLAPHRLNPTLSAGIEAVLRKGLSKKPDARYRTCAEFVDALEKACNATRGWKPMARGDVLNEPTAAEAARPVNLPPARRARAAETTMTAEQPPKRRMGFLAFLLSLFLVAGLLALIGWQADPALPQKAQDFSRKVQTALGLSGPAAQPTQTVQPAAQTVPPAPAEPAQSQATAPGAEVKPSPMPPPAAVEPEPVSKSAERVDAPAAAPAPARARVRPAGPQAISIVSSPAGATATLDGRADAACSTPCVLDAAPGRHAIAVTMPGYQVEYRDVEVGSSPVELPPVVLRAPSGTLMLTTLPDGATVSINGKRLPQTTPARIPLAPGNYTVQVEKGGKQATSPVEVRNGAISYLRIVL